MTKHVALLDNILGKELHKKVLSLKTEADEFYFNKKELYLLSRKKFSDSEFSGKFLKKTLKMETTIRNLTTQL